jgi:hypothetical protein
MLSDYTFLTDHSYSLRPVADDNDELPLTKREEKTKKRRRSSNRTNQTTSTTNRTVSIDRSSSDKENNSLILSSSSNVSIPVINNSLNTNKSSTNVRVTKKKSIGSRGSRLSTRTAMTNSRTQSGKKQDNKTSSKTGVKSTQGSIMKKKKSINRGKTKLLNISQLDSSDAQPSLSIEERVKLRRTKPLQSSTILVEKKSTKNKKSQSRTTKIPTVQQDIKQIRQSITNNSSKKDEKIKPTKTSSVVSTNKSTKLFLGSGLDLDNIVLGNRQRRCVQT